MNSEVLRYNKKLYYMIMTKHFLHHGQTFSRQKIVTFYFSVHRVLDRHCILVETNVL